MALKYIKLTTKQVMEFRNAIQTASQLTQAAKQAETHLQSILGLIYDVALVPETAQLKEFNEKTNELVVDVPEAPADAKPAGKPAK